MAITRPAVGDLVAAAWGQAVTDQLNALNVPVPWVALALINGWSNYSNGYQLAQYRKVGDMVQVRGLIKNTGVTAPSTFAVMAAGYRAPANLQFAQDGAGSHAFVEVSSNGNFNLQGPSGAQAAFNINFQYSVTV